MRIDNYLQKSKENFHPPGPDGSRRGLDDSAIAYGWVGFLLLVVMGGLLYILMTPMVNELIMCHNRMAGEGLVSAQTSGVFNFQVGLFTAALIFGLLGFAGYMVVKALEKWEGGM